MKYFKLLLFLMAFLSVNPCLSQKQEEVAKFTITESSKNGKDDTPFDLNRGGCFVFYMKSKKMYFANVSEKTDEQSFGQIFNTKIETKPETSTQYKKDDISFTWNYQNNYDKNTGYATVILSKIYKPQGVIFNIGIILTNLDLFEYKGYMQGSLNFEIFLK